MGKFKKEHLADILAFEHVGEQFRRAHGRDFSETDLNEMFDMFRPTMAEVAVTGDLIRPFDGVKEAIDRLQAEGIQVGCDTGYPARPATPSMAPWRKSLASALMSSPIPKTSAGRPTPFLVYDCMYKANVYPPAAVIKADDITAGVQDGANSGPGRSEFTRPGLTTVKRSRTPVPITWFPVPAISQT